MNWMERVFKLSEHGTNVRTELVAGLTTFLTMARSIQFIALSPCCFRMRGATVVKAPRVEHRLSRPAQGMAPCRAAMDLVARIAARGFKE